MEDEALLNTCHRAVDAVRAALEKVDDWSPPGRRPGQYAIDLVADDAALEVLGSAGIGVLSEESGLHESGSGLVAVLDPVDGSTNASRGIPWYACSICVVDSDGPRVSVVANLAQGVRYQAIRGVGAWIDGVSLRPSGCASLRSAVIGLSGFPHRHLGWAQFRAFGAAALDMCGVAEGKLDAFSTGGSGGIAPWDYMGALLVCTEAGAPVAELHGQPLVTLEMGVRRSIAAAATTQLLQELSAAHSVAGAASSKTG